MQNRAYCFRCLGGHAWRRFHGVLKTSILNSWGSYSCYCEFFQSGLKGIWSPNIRSSWVKPHFSEWFLTWIARKWTSPWGRKCHWPIERTVSTTSVGLVFYSDWAWGLLMTPQAQQGEKMKHLNLEDGWPEIIVCWDLGQQLLFPESFHLFFCNTESSAGHLKSHSIIYTRRFIFQLCSPSMGCSCEKKKIHAWRFPRAPEGLSGTKHAKWTSKRSLLTKVQEQKLPAGLFTLSIQLPSADNSLLGFLFLLLTSRFFVHGV